MFIQHPSTVRSQQKTDYQVPNAMHCPRNYMSLCDLSEVIHQLDLKVQCGKISPLTITFLRLRVGSINCKQKHLKNGMTISSNKFPSFFPCLCMFMSDSILEINNKFPKSCPHFSEVAQLHPFHQPKHTKNTPQGSGPSWTSANICGTFVSGFVFIHFP